MVSAEWNSEIRVGDTWTLTFQLEESNDDVNWTPMPTPGYTASCLLVDKEIDPTFSIEANCALNTLTGDYEAILTPEQTTTIPDWCSKLFYDAKISTSLDADVQTPLYGYLEVLR